MTSIVARGIKYLMNDLLHFENFVVGECNQFAHAAAIDVAKKPANNYNPLFIYGGSGLGKTHLLHAIGLKIMASHAGSNVIYISAEELMYEWIKALRDDQRHLFKDKYRSIECLLVDDANFLSGKERTQQEFLHIINTMYGAGRQIVIASENFPLEILHLKEQFRSRFQWGLVANVNSPDMETRVAIIKKKAKRENISIPDNAVRYIASHVESNIGELEGILTTISGYSSFAKREINYDLVKEVLLFRG